MKRSIKALIATFGVLSFLFAPLAHGSVLGFATTDDIRLLQQQIVDVARQVVELQTQLAAKKGLLLGSATVTAGNNYPTSSYTFNDDDIINAGDINNVTTYLGTRTATDTASVSGRLNNLSSTITSGSGALPSSTWLKTTNNLSDLSSTSSARSSIGYSGGTGISIAATGTITNTGVTSLNGSTGTVSYNVTINQASGPAYNFTIATTSGAPSVVTSTSGGSSTIAFNVPSGGGGSTPAGSSTDVQFNGSGSLAADTGNFTYNSSTKALSVSHASSSVNIGPYQTQLSFAYTGATSTWVAPAGTTTITVTAYGAQGGTGSLGNVGGLGGKSVATFQVSSGTTYYVSVGGAGSGATAGFNGGGTGGGGGVPGGGGGGMTTFASSNGALSTSTTFIIAAGGGGGAGDTSSSTAGFGGGLTGGSPVLVGTTGVAAGGGTQTTGGTAGTGTGCSGGAGAFGLGGSGCSAGNRGSGGGGGGLFGGGAGGVVTADVSNPGAGGSAWFIASATATSTATGTNSGNGSLVISYTASLSGYSYALNVNGHIITGGPTPTVSSCGGGSSVAGSDTAGLLTLGSSTQSCTFTFATIFPSAPSCAASIASGTSNSFKFATTVSTTVMTASSTMATSSKINYMCLGY